MEKQGTRILETERLILRMASDEELCGLIASAPIDELKQAYGEMLALCRQHPEMRQWYTAWFAELPDGTRVGDLGFKGLADDGTVEIGYGMLPEYEGRGYMTEAVRALTLWAAHQPGVTRIEAETDPDNCASMRVLEKSGFVPTGTNGEEGPRFVWSGEIQR